MHYYVSDSQEPQGFKEITEAEWLARPANSIAVKPQVSTCTVTIKPTGKVLLRGYIASVYEEDNVYCNYAIPYNTNYYEGFVIENAICGSALPIFATAKRGAVNAYGAECLDSAEDYDTYIFKVANEDMEITLGN